MFHAQFHTESAGNLHIGQAALHCDLIKLARFAEHGSHDGAGSADRLRPAVYGVVHSRGYSGDGSTSAAPFHADVQSKRVMQFSLPCRMEAAGGCVMKRRFVVGLSVATLLLPVLSITVFGAAGPRIYVPMGMSGRTTSYPAPAPPTPRPSASATPRPSASATPRRPRPRLLRLLHPARRRLWGGAASRWTSGTRR